VTALVLFVQNHNIIHGLIIKSTLVFFPLITFSNICMTSTLIARIDCINDDVLAHPGYSNFIARIELSFKFSLIKVYILQLIPNNMLVNSICTYM